MRPPGARNFNKRQFDIANSGLPLASLISLAQTFWIAPTALSGIGT